MSEDARLRLEIARRLPGFELNVRLDVGAEVLVIFGPSGAGKTTLLDVVAGLSPADEGSIQLDGKTLFRRGRPGRGVNLPSRERRVGYVMQSYGLFPHRTALENVGYPLRREPERDERALALLDQLGIGELRARYPAELSGGQQQRVAIARALATGTPLLLLDEPFAALDGALRTRLQADLRRLQRELRLVVLLVTHQLEDAFAMGDRIAVIRHGRIEQVGPIDDVFRRPASQAVAEIMGIRNLLRATVTETGPTTRLDWDGLSLQAPPSSAAVGDEVTAYIRPEDVKIIYADRPLAPSVSANLFDARITLARQQGAARVVQVQMPNGRELEIRFPLSSYASVRLEPGGPVRVALRGNGLTILDSAGPAR